MKSAEQPEPPEAEFRRFLEAARPLLRESISDRLKVLQDAMRCLSPWLLDKKFDLLRVAQLTWAEDPYTELVAWAIDPATHPEIGAACQRAWLLSLGITATIDPLTPITQFSTDDGIPDLVLPYPELLVIVEAKTGTGEHPTPKSCKPQTVAYPDAVKRRLGRPNDFRTKTVYLTVDCTEAENGKAIRTCYFAFAVLLADTLTKLDMPDDLKSMYKLIISHFATQTAVFGVDVRNLCFLAEENLDENRVIEHVTSLTHMQSLLPERAGN